MRNIKLTIAYDGSKYAGWQIQATKAIPHKPTIQGKIEEALRKIFQKKIPLIGSGRTDAGVHAVGQIANFKTESTMTLDRLKAALNGILPFDIAILKAEEAGLSFHSRFDARSKIYRYIVVNQPARPAFLRSHACWVRPPLDVKAMQREARHLLGRHDFKSFQAHDRVERASVTTVQKIIVKGSNGCDTFPFLKDLKLIVIDIQAKGFARNMVRNMVGTLLEAGKGRLEAGGMVKILKKKDRRSAGPCAPGHGLYLMEVSYE